MPVVSRTSLHLRRASVSVSRGIFAAPSSLLVDCNGIEGIYILLYNRRQRALLIHLLDWDLWASTKPSRVDSGTSAPEYVFESVKANTFTPRNCPVE
ncbi:hypothetical protein BC939DRAFT_433699 [Gamsiella multidivaricata]|uniref:uncharacterized protein n=1 Tax=Gamsiella multidivaricata TaxID=101098 RepID=UPI00221F864C|nr:uncharacterized protein BC939DRAFT_433699 [Gamsiella multidivaricata]KAI7832546.1 hypothetical protein BC939DRAFT_433699 [Gamsiella multidivaricata]